jgi:type IV secretory pathway TrbD component
LMGAGGAVAMVGGLLFVVVVLGARGWPLARAALPRRACAR